MNFLEATFIDIGRIGMGSIFLFSIVLDIKMRHQIFDLMREKRVPMPWFFYIGAIIWKTVTSIGLIFNIYAFWTAWLLALYIFIATIIFDNFWSVPKSEREYTLVLFLIHLAACFGLMVISGTAAAAIY